MYCCESGMLHIQEIQLQITAKVSLKCKLRDFFTLKNISSQPATSKWEFKQF